MYGTRVEGGWDVTPGCVYGYAMLYHGCEGVEGNGDVFDGGCG